MVVSGLIDENKVNYAEVPVPYNVEQIKDNKNSLETEIERDDIERPMLPIAKMNLEGEKPTRFFCSLEKQMK